MSLRTSYRIIAPVYDWIVSRPLRKARQLSLAHLPANVPQRVLLSGVGTGLDCECLPPVHHYVGVDATRAMLRRAVRRCNRLKMTLIEGDCQQLPFPEAAFDHAILHLIVAVVPDPPRCLGECVRVVKPGGVILIFDKFLRRGERAWARRALNPLSSRIATRTDVIFEDVLAHTPGLRLVDDQPAYAGGWFRHIRLVRLPDR